MARPKGSTKNLDKSVLENLCKIQCNEEEIAAFFGVSIDTIKRFCLKNYGLNFRETRKIFSQAGKVSLRRFQFRQAKNNVTMAIWLGKQYLNQKDIIENYENAKIEIINDVPKIESEVEEN